MSPTMANGIVGCQPIEDHYYTVFYVAGTGLRMGTTKPVAKSGKERLFRP